MSIDRRDFLIVSAGLGAAAIGGCNRSDANELRVFVYAGGHERTMREAFVPAFEKQSGMRVTLHSGWWDGIAKLKTASDNPPYDLMITDATQGYPASRDGLFARLDFAKIPSFAGVHPVTRDNPICREGFGATYPDSAMTLAWNRDRVKQPIARWADLLRDDLAGKVGLYNNFYMSLYTLACVLADSQGRAGQAQNLIRTKTDEVFAFAKDFRKRVGVWWPTSTDMILALDNGDCLAGNMHSPEYIQAMREKPALAATVPDADRAFVQVFWVVPKNAKRSDAAHRAIDLLFSEPMQLAFARRGQATSIESVATTVAAEDPFWKQLYPHTAAMFPTLTYYPYDFYAEHWDELSDRWDTTVLRSG